MQYKDFVDYSKLDPVKRAALEKFSEGLSNPERLGVRIVTETLGESAVALDFLDYDFMIAFNVEGLGTKNIIADIMSKDPRGRGLKYYEDIGKDCVAMSSNDLLSIGADIIVYGDIISSGKSEWFTEENARVLLEGYRKASSELGMAIPCGETPTLKGVVNEGTLDLAGASVGIIKPRSRLIHGQELSSGDRIFGLCSSGVHSNGISLIRKIAEDLPEGYFTRLPSGRIFGEELLIPTMLYTRPVIDMLDEGANIHYITPITGHGWEKIGRAKKPFTYIIDKLHEIPEIFSFLQEKAGIDDKEAFRTWNMGIGLALIAPSSEEDKIKSICTQYGIGMFNLGYLEEGEKKVAIKERNVLFEL